MKIDDSKSKWTDIHGFPTEDPHKKPPIQVVRIEHTRDGNGFWNSRDECESLFYWKHSKRSNIVNRHFSPEYPNYDDDIILNSQIGIDDMKPYKFAFKTLDQFKVAFTAEELKECLELGFRIYLLTVDDYFESPFQVVFKDPISKEDISNLFK